jgi:hypothetical protein
MRHSDHFEQLYASCIPTSNAPPAMFPALMDVTPNGEAVCSTWVEELLTLRDRRIAIRNEVMIGNADTEIDGRMRQDPNVRSPFQRTNCIQFLPGLL